MSYEDIKCPKCGKIGYNCIDETPALGHPNVVEKWLVCECGEDLMEITG